VTFLCRVVIIEAVYVSHQFLPGRINRHRRCVYYCRGVTQTLFITYNHCYNDPVRSFIRQRQSAVSAISRPYIRRATSAWRRTCAERLSSLGLEKNTAKKTCTEIMQRCKYPERRT